jgi:phage gp16-like protein
MIYHMNIKGNGTGMQETKLKKAAEQSKRYFFIAEHRGGPLTKENHSQLIKWARECSEHVLSLIEKKVDNRLLYALDVAREWEKGDLPTGAAIKASLMAHEVARESEDPVSKAVARAVGQTVATAHMADHSLGGAFYALKAVKLAKNNLEREREWQTKRLNELPSEIIQIVKVMWEKKGLDKRI